MGVFIFWFSLSLIVAYFANKKGQSGTAYFLISIILSPLIGFLIYIFAKDESNEKAIKNGTMKKCFACAELIKIEAVKCKHCGEKN